MLYFLLLSIQSKHDKVKESLSDKDIMLAVKNGDIKKLGLLFEKYHLMLFNYFTKMTYNQQVSEDMVQEVFHKLIKYRHTYRGEGIFTTWMFQIAHNTFYDFVRREKKHLSIEDDNINVPDSTDLHETVAEREDLRHVRDAIHTLPDDYREVLILRCYHNMKYKDIAEMLDCPVGTVKARVHHGINKLKEILLS